MKRCGCGHDCQTCGVHCVTDSLLAEHEDRCQP